jgi:hypothetical protein
VGYNFLEQRCWRLAACFANQGLSTAIQGKQVRTAYTSGHANGDHSIKLGKSETGKKSISSVRADNKKI